MNEVLRRTVFAAGMTEEDVASHLAVDPKTVRRWLGGRLPFPRHRHALAELLGSDESQLWPELGAVRAARSKPDEVRAVYPHRWAITRDGWFGLFEAACEEIAVLVYSGLFLAEDAGLLKLLRRKAGEGVRVRIALGDPDGPPIADRGAAEGIDDAMAAKIRNALVLYRPLCHISGVELRLHRTVLYNSLYRSDDGLLVNQHLYGVPASHAPVIHLRRADGAEMFASYLESFERIWDAATAIVPCPGFAGTANST